MRAKDTQQDSGQFGSSTAFTQFRVLLAKDLKHEFRTREMLTSMGLYSLLVLIVFGVVFALLGHDIDARSFAGGLIWVLVVFTSLLGLGRSFAFERESSCIEGLMLVPMDRSVIYLAKTVSNLLFLLIVEAIVLPLFYFFFLTGQPMMPTFWYSLVPLLLGTVGISAVGTLLSSMTANARSRDVLLAVLFIPTIFPLLYACVGATTACVAGTAEWYDSMLFGCVLAAAYDIVMLLASWVLYEYMIES